MPYFRHNMLIYPQRYPFFFFYNLFIGEKLLIFRLLLMPNVRKTELSVRKAESNVRKIARRPQAHTVR